MIKRQIKVKSWLENIWIMVVSKSKLSAKRGVEFERPIRNMDNYWIKVLLENTFDSLLCCPGIFHCACKVILSYFTSVTVIVFTLLQRPVQSCFVASGHLK